MLHRSTVLTELVIGDSFFLRFPLTNRYPHSPLTTDVNVLS